MGVGGTMLSTKRIVIDELTNLVNISIMLIIHYIRLLERCLASLTTNNNRACLPGVSVDCALSYCSSRLTETVGPH